MNSIKISLFLISLICIPTLFAAESIVSLNTSSFKSSNQDTLFVYDSSFSQSVYFTPVFPEPVDSEKRQIWSSLGMDQFYFAHYDNSIRENDLYLFNMVDNIYPCTPDQYPLTTPNDYNIYDLWHLDSLFCPSAWDEFRGESEILLATIDTGCNIFHPDLAANIYVNPGEDLNGNGIFELEDINGVDDDDNGKIDDISGWDLFNVGEPNPWEINFTRLEDEDYSDEDPFVYPDHYGHGTLVAGLQAAVSNNGIGIASAAWNIKTMPIRAAGAWIDPNGNLMATGMSSTFGLGVYYAVNCGVDIISISFGGTSEDNIYRLALEYAEQNNVMVICAAGNSNSETRTYPAGYETTISVANIDRNNRKASDSNYGDWVDIAAPGVDVWSTHTDNIYHPGEYVLASGTSISAPIVASAIGLALSANPILRVEDLKVLIETSVDEIDDINPEYSGKLGAGRLNAQKLVNHALNPIWQPENLVLQYDDVSSSAFLTWENTQLGSDQEGFLCYEIFRNGVFRGSSDTEEYEEDIEISGLVEYKVRAMYERGSSDYTNKVYIYNVNPAVVSPDSSECKIIDPYLGVSKVRWRRCSSSDTLRFDDLDPNLSCTYKWKRCCQSVWATVFERNGIARLTTLKVLARKTANEILTIELYPFIDGEPSTEPIITREIDDLVDGWNTIDVFSESIILEGTFLVSAKSTSLSLLEIAYNDSLPGHSYYKNGNQWITHPHSVITSASIAYFEDILDHTGVSFEPNRVNRQATLNSINDENPFCVYHVFRNGIEVGTTLNNEFVDTLANLGLNSYRVESRYFNGEMGEPLPVNVDWAYPELHFSVTDPTQEFKYLKVNNSQLDRGYHSYPLEIFVYDKDVCVGAISGKSEDFPKNILLWKENPSSPGSGFIDSDSLEIRVWDTQYDRELTVYYSSTNRQFTFGAIDESTIDVFSFQPDYRGNFTILNPWDGRVFNRAQIERVVVEWNRFMSNLLLNKSISYWLNYRIHVNGQVSDTIVFNEGNYLREINLLDLIPVEEWEDTLGVDIWVETRSDLSVFTTDTIQVSIIPNKSASPPNGIIPEKFELTNAYPNPFNSTLNLNFDLPESSAIKIKIFDIEGRLVFKDNRYAETGMFRTRIKPENLPSGIYFLEAHLGGKHFTRKIVHLK